MKTAASPLEPEDDAIVRRIVAAIICEHVGEIPDHDAPIENQMTGTSTDFVEAILMVEEHFELEFADDEDPTSINSIADLVMKKKLGG